MKKLVSIALACVFALTMSVSAFADNFVPSASNPGAPGIEEQQGSVPGRELKLTPYNNRTTLPEYKCAELEGAYDVIAKASPLTSINSDLIRLAASMDVEEKDLAVSDVFDISEYENGVLIENTGDEYTVTLKSEVIKSFVALLHYTDGAWTVVEGTSLDKDAATVTFTADSFSPFALVVNGGDFNDGPVAPPTGVIMNVMIAAAGILALSGIVLLIVSKNRKTEEEA